MAVLNREVLEVQNSALGALLLWRTAAAYQKARDDAAPCPFHFLFLPLPLLLSEDTLCIIDSTQRTSGLRSLVTKFTTSANNQSDILLTLHDRVLTWREISLGSLGLALASRLLRFATPPDRLVPLSHTPPRHGLPSSVRRLQRNAEKLGHWFAMLTPHEVSLALKVRF